MMAVSQTIGWAGGGTVVPEGGWYWWRSLFPLGAVLEDGSEEVGIRGGQGGGSRDSSVMRILKCIQVKHDKTRCGNKLTDLLSVKQDKTE